MPDQSSLKKVMIIDDDSFLLEMYSKKFSKAGYDVKIVNSTDLALKVLRDGYAPDIMLVDIVMPGMDGLELVSKIKAENLAPTSTVIMLTNQSSSGDVSRAQKIKVDGYIIKATSIPSDVLTQMEQIYSSKVNK